MTVDFVTSNTESRQRMERYLGELSDDDLRRMTSGGWTVAALLVHMAYWDQRMLALLRRWQTEGVGESPVDPDMINDALQPIALALEPRTAVMLCLESARAIDAALAAASPDLIAAIANSGNHFRFNRAIHRNDHLGEIERTLAA